MYICLCHGVTESAIRAAAAGGARTFRQLSFMTGCGTQCGSCAEQAEALLAECLASPQSQQHPPQIQQHLPRINCAA